MALSTQPAVAYLAGGKIKLRTSTEKPHVIESKFAQTIRDRAVKNQERHAWKGGDSGGGMFAGPSLWGKNAAQDAAAIPISITSICRGSTVGQLLYSLESDSTCSMLAIEDYGADERRLWNHHKTAVTRLNMNADGDIVASVEHQFGTANIGIKLAGEGSGFGEVTEGDSLDTAPRWVMGRTNEIVFQSAGVGRNQHGHIAALGPFAVHHLKVDSGEMEVLAEDSQYDFLTPAMLDNGTLYYIRRPYLAALKPSFFAVIKDVLLFPFRLLYSILQFLNFFAFLFTGKKLNRAGTVPQKEMDIKQMLIWGRHVQAQRNRSQGDEAPDLVPQSWELIRRDSDGEEKTIARGVLDFDVTPQGQVVYTNGNALFSIGPNGESKKIQTDTMISQVTFLCAA